MLKNIIHLSLESTFFHINTIPEKPRPLRLASIDRGSRRDVSKLILMMHTKLFVLTSCRLHGSQALRSVFQHTRRLAATATDCLRPYPAGRAVPLPAA